MADKPEFPLDEVMALHASGKGMGEIRKHLLKEHHQFIDVNEIRHRIDDELTRQSIEAAKLNAAKMAAEFAAAKTAITAAEMIDNVKGGPEERRMTLLSRAELVWACMPPEEKKNGKLYLELERIAFQYLKVQFQLAAITGDTKKLDSVESQLQTKLDNLFKAAEVKSNAG